MSRAKIRHPVAINDEVYKILSDIRDFSGISSIRLITLLFEHNALIKRNTIHNFFDDFSLNNREFKEWQRKQQKENEDE